MPLPEVLLDPDPFGVAARRVADALETVAGASGRARFALPGGSAAGAAARAVAILGERGFDAGRLHLTWVDERCVPASAADSNRGTARIHPAPGFELALFLDDERPAEAVARVEQALTGTFGAALDVVLLGMGADGHVASLFPGRPPLSGLVAHVADSPKPPFDRITLTRALLATARHTVLVAAGEEKRAALERLRGGDTGLPATGLPCLTICTDLELGERR